MRKGLLCVPMMILLLLSACADSRAGRQAEELALIVRGEWLECADCTAAVDITADYGLRVYRYTMELTAREGEISLTVTAPDTVAGITARTIGTDGFLEYDGLVLETGPLDEEGLTPVSAVPVILEAVRSGYITACGLDETGTVLRVDYGRPEGMPGTGTEIVLWFDAASHTPIRAEIMSNGVRVIDCTFSNFTRG